MVSLGVDGSTLLNTKKIIEPRTSHTKIFFKKCIKSLGVIFKLITKKAINPNSKNESNPKSPLKFIITVPSSYPNKPENI